MDGEKEFQNRVLICADCKEEFIFTAEAQQYFFKKGHTEIPKRCKNCYANVCHGTSGGETRIGSNTGKR